MLVMICHKTKKPFLNSLGKVLLFRRASSRIRTNDPRITSALLWPTELWRLLKRFAKIVVSTILTNLKSIIYENDLNCFLRAFNSPSASLIFSCKSAFSLSAVGELAKNSMLVFQVEISFSRVAIFLFIESSFR